MKIELFQPGQEGRISEILIDGTNAGIPHIYTKEEADVLNTYYVPQVVRDRALNGKATTLVAVEGSDIIGTGTIENDGFIKRVYVDIRHQGKGIGSLLLKKLETIGLNLGVMLFV